MPSSPRVDRRSFLLRAGQPRRVLSLSCERLYMQYMEAIRLRSAPRFLARLERQLGAADEVRLTAREWLAREEFRADIEPLLRARSQRIRLT